MADDMNFIYFLYKLMLSILIGPNLKFSEGELLFQSSGFDFKAQDFSLKLSI